MRLLRNTPKMVKKWQVYRKASSQFFYLFIYLLLVLGGGGHRYIQLKRLQR
jgi:hypothetical protein